MLLKKEHAYLKLLYGLSDDQQAQVLLSYFEDTNDFCHTGEAHYIVGANYYAHQNGELAVYHLKQAEELLLRSHEIPSTLLGMTYYQLGNVMEEARLFQIANDYFLKALTFLQDTSNPYYLAYLYRDLARSCTIEQKEEVKAYVDSAMHYAAWVQDMGLCRELEIILYENCLNQDTSLILRNQKYLCDSLRYYVYAEDIASYYIRKGQIDSALQYLNILAEDTAYHIWSKEHYWYHMAECLEANHAYAEAIATLSNLHQWQTNEIETSANERAYMVEQRYDAERERSRKQRAESQLHMTIVIGVASILLLISFFFIVYFAWRNEKTKVTLRENEKLMLEQLIKNKRDALKAIFRTRADISKKLYKKDLITHKTWTPATVKKLLYQITMAEDSDWKSILHEFDLAYNQLLSRIKEAYPAITKGDQQYIVLSLLGCSPEDISVLMGTSNRTIWNRKQVVKRHLGLPQEVDLDEWLIQQAER